MSTLISEISEKISRKPRHSRSQEAQRHLKYLSVKFPKHHSQEFDLQRIKIASSAARNTFKHSFSKKIQSMKLQPHVFPYYAPYLRGKLTELTFMRYGDYGYWRASEINKAIVYPSLGSFKHLKKLSIPDPFLSEYVQMARRIRGLENLQITLPTAQISRYFSLFHSLPSLQNVNLRVFYGRSEPEDEKKLRMLNRVYRFLKDLTSLKNLKTLTLNAEDSPEFREQKLQAMFLELFAKSPVKEYDLAFTLLFSQTVEANKLFSEVDSLRLASERLGYHPKDPDGQIKLKRNMSFVIPTFCQISDLVSKFANIKLLVLEKVDAEDMIFDSIESNPNLEILKFRVSFKLKSRTLKLMTWIADYIADSKLKFIQIQLVHLHKDLFEQFVRIHNALCPLKTETYKLANPDYESRNVDPQFIPLKNNMLRFVTDKISHLTSLKVLSLELCLEGPESVKYIDRLFDHLPNLTQLALILYRRTKGKMSYGPWMMTMPLSKSKKLEDVRLNFSRIFKFKNLIGFFQGVSQLEQLKVLNIRCSDVENMTKESKDNILTLLKKCSTCHLGSFTC